MILKTLYLHLDFAVNDVDWKAGGRFFAVPADGRARLDVELPAVQRTGDAPILNQAFSQRTAAVRTSSVKRIALSIEFEQREFAATHVDAQSAVGGDLVYFGDRDEFGHPESGRRVLKITARRARFRHPREA